MAEGERRKSSETLMAQGSSNFRIAASCPGALKRVSVLITKIGQEPNQFEIFSTHNQEVELWHS